jgi:hypothetical protein
LFDIATADLLAWPAQRTREPAQAARKEHGKLQRVVAKFKAKSVKCDLKFSTPVVDEKVDKTVKGLMEFCIC